MNLGEIRRGIAQTIEDQIVDVRVQPVWPNSPQFGAAVLVVVLPDDPYVTYTEGAGRPNMNEIMFRLVCLPLPSMGAERVQAELDALLSCGSGEARSLRTALGSDLSAAGTACSVSVLQASIRTYRIGESEPVGAEVQVKVTARC